MHPSYHCQSIFLKHKSDCLTPLLNVTYEIALELYKWPFIVCPSLLSRLICQQSLPALTHGHTRLVPGQITLVHMSVYFKFCSRGGCPTSSSPLSSYDMSRPRPSSSPRWGLWPPQAIGSPCSELPQHLLHAFLSTYYIVQSLFVNISPSPPPELGSSSEESQAWQIPGAQ